MVWFYERHGTFIRCETRDTTEGVVELLIVQPDGTESVERFADSRDLTRRRQELQSTLSDSGWQGPFGRTI